MIARRCAAGRTMWRVLAVLALLAVLGAGLAGWALHARLQAPVVAGGAPVTLVIAPGTPFARVANDLAAASGYAHPRFLTAYARYRGLASAIQAGEYRIEPGTGIDALLQKLVDGDVVLHRLTVIEGWTFEEFLAALRAHPLVTQTLEESAPAAVMDRLGRSGEHPEGRFFPDTYTFARGTTDVAILEQAYAAMAKRLAAAWARRTPACVLKEPYEALILASIIEKETGHDSERRTISGVFHRRLARGMRLQTDPTVIYGLGAAFDGDLRRRDLRTDTPYNTYTRGGLPPTPIALPGEASLAAAVDPEDGNALYFVATGDGDGRHYFSATLDEHNRAVERYLAKLRAPK